MATNTTQDAYVIRKASQIQSQIRALATSVVEDIDSQARKYKGGTYEERYKRWLNKLYKYTSELKRLENEF